MINDDINLFLGVFSYPLNIDFLKRDLLQEYYRKESSARTVMDKAALRQDLAEFMRKYHYFSYDEIYLYLDKWYLHYSNENENSRDSFEVIWEHLSRFSKSFISQRDGKIVYKYWENENDRNFLGGFSENNKIYLFHALNRLMPLDLLVMIYMIENQKEIYELDGHYGNIEVSDTLLDRVLESGVAENHLHSGVAVPFLSNWDGLMKPLDDKIIIEIKKSMSRKSKSFSEIDSCGNKFLLLLANLLRNCILLKILAQSQMISIGDLDEQIRYFINTFQSDFETQLNFFCSAPCEKPLMPEMESMFLEQWKKMQSFIYTKEFEMKSVLENCFEGIKDLNTSDENLFLYIAAQYITREKRKSNSEEYRDSTDYEAYSVVKNLFLNYLRIKIHFYQLVVQQKTILGLNFFQKEYYRKNSAFSEHSRKFIGKERWERALREQLQNKNLKKLEFRTSIFEREADFKNHVNDFLKAYLNILHSDFCRCLIRDNQEVYEPVKAFPRVGLVFHLLKREQDCMTKQCFYAKDKGPEFLSYGALHASYKKQIDLLKALRDGRGGFVYDKYLLGIDVASLENEVPTWVFADLFEEARDSKTDPIRKSSPRTEHHQSLSFTFHAGEDFRHLLSGLRRIYEVITHLKFHAGDRIGHGIALGMDPKKWFLHHHTVILPKIEALENYIWAYNLLSNNEDFSLSMNLDFIEKKINYFSKEIFGQNSAITVNTWIDFYQELFKRNVFRPDTDDHTNTCSIQSKCQNTFCKKKHCSDDTILWNVDTLFYARHCHRFTHKMNEPIHIKIAEQEVSIMQTVQDLVKREMSRKGIVVEVNPSSNTVIADLDTIKENQVYGIHHYQYHLENLITCINSDDPSIFNTNVSNELGYIYFGMLERDINREAALHWIDKLRSNGMMASFIRRTDTDIQILRELEEFVKQI